MATGTPETPIRRKLGPRSVLIGGIRGLLIESAVVIAYLAMALALAYLVSVVFA
jgi:hypothetical protein